MSEEKPKEKRCTKCGEVKGLGEFSRKKSGKYGRSSACKKCLAKCHRRYREQNREKLREKKQRYYEQNREKLREKKQRYYEQNREKYLEYQRRYREQNPEKLLEKKRRYWEQNREKLLEKKRRYWEQNREKHLEHQRQWREQNPEKVRQMRRRYYEQNREKLIEKSRWYREQNRDGDIREILGMRDLLKALEDEERPADSALCPDCAATPGELHGDGCDVERCPDCGCQIISCSCKAFAHDRLPWEGEWPGLKECREFNLWARWGPPWIPCENDDPAATEDLNRLREVAEWNADAGRWILKKHH